MTDAAMLASSGYARLPDDAYNTPAWVTEALLDNVKLPRHIWEPAAGDGVMVRVLQQYGHIVMATDIAGATKTDFLQQRTGRTLPAIVTNPPYSLADKFIRHALKLMEPCNGRVAMLLRNEFDSAKKRADLFADNPHFTAKLVLTRRPRWIEDTTTSPRHNFAWYIWDYSHEGPPIIRWAP